MSKEAKTVEVEYVGGGPMDGRTIDLPEQVTTLGRETRIKDGARAYVYRLERWRPHEGKLVWRLLRTEAIA